MTWIQPLELQTWLVSVFAGTSEIFAAIALLVVTTMAAYFRMNGISLLFIVAIFLLMFSGFINSVLLAIMAIVGGILIGYWLWRIFVQ